MMESSCHAMKLGPLQIRREDDDEICNFAGSAH